MRVTAVETIQLGEFPNLCLVRLHTDEGLVGLGETFFGAAAVAAHIHETAAGRSSAGTRRPSTGSGSRSRITSARARPESRPGPTRPSTSRSGTSSARRRGGPWWTSWAG
jgi:L-alanine-DL-glutamate epimerase-like enolase superfamily enzyme